MVRLDSCYIYLLLVSLRKLVSKKDRLNCLVSSYLNGNGLNSLVQKEQFFNV